SARTFAGDGDVLGVGAGGLAGTGISASYDAGTETLTLTGIDTLAHYQQALEHVTFSSISSNPTNSGLNPTRTVEWQVNDGSAANNLSAVQDTTIQLSKLAPQNDFNGDAHSDFLWQTDANQLAIWQLDGFQISAADYTRLGSSQ